MASNPAIPERYHDELMMWHNERNTVPQIKELFFKVHGLTISVNSIYRTLSKLRKLRQEIAKNVYVQEVQRTALQDVALMTEMIAVLKDKFDKAKKSSEQVQFAGELRLYLKDKMILTGIDKKDFDIDHLGAREEMLEELRKLLPPKNE